VYGTRQSGVLKLKVADLVKDSAIMEQSRQAAIQLLSADPGLQHPAHAALREALRQRGAQSQWNKIS